MNCDRALEQMSAMLDGELTQQEREQLQAHLAACQSCRAVYAELSAMDEAIAAAQAEPPAALREGVMGAVRDEQKRKSARRTRGRVTAALVAAAALALVVLSGLGVVQLPGFGGESWASVSVGKSFETILPQEPLEAEQAAYAAQLAEEYGCTVLAVWGCDGLDELQDCASETVDGGAQLYLSDGAALDAIFARYDGQYTMERYMPQSGGQTGGETAYIVLFP